MDKKIEFISANIGSVENTSEIINFIDMHNINYSENLNGRFINLSILNEKYINDIFNIIKNLLKNDDNIFCEKDNQYTTIINSKNIEKYETLKLNNFEEKILKYNFNK